jgi:outer membrane lipase/esterase
MKNITLVLWVVAVFALSTSSVFAQYVPSEVVSFGDSVSDDGNAGGIFTNSPSQSGAGITGVWVDQLAAMYNYKLTDSNSGGTDYAQAGATTSSTFGSNNTANQVTAYLANTGGAAPSGALYTFFAGGNDIIDTATSPYSILTSYEAVQAANNIEAQINSIVNAGGTTILWANLPSINLTPDYAGNTTIAAAVTAFNNQYTIDVAALRAEHPTINLVTLDYYSLSNNIYNNPSAYGFTDVTDAWTTASAGTPYSEASNDPNADKFVSWDGLHPTTRGHQLLADAAYNALETPEPSPGILLGLGLAFGGVMVLVQRRLRAA